MCGRMVQVLTPEMVKDVLQIRENNVNLKVNYNLAPKQMAGVVRLNPKSRARAFNELQWWLVPARESPDHKFATFNARSEEVATKKMFRNAWAAGRRCLVPINAYYEWQTRADGKQPYAIGRKDGQLMTLAGLWEGKHLENGDILRTFTVLTTAAQGEMAALHNRIPVMIEREHWGGWLGETEIDPNPLLHPPDNALLVTWPVSSAVGNVRHNEPALLEALKDV